MPLVPGEGFWIRNPTDNPLLQDFHGDVLQGRLTNSLPAGFALAGSSVPQVDAFPSPRYR
jgi:hypothetical protein